MLRSLAGRIRHLRYKLRTAPSEIKKAGHLRTWLFYLPGPGPWFMSWLRRKWVIFRNPQAHIEFQGPVYLGPGFSLHMPDGGTFIVGPGVEFRRGFRAEIGPEGRIVIGPACFFTYDVIMSCHTSIELGTRVGIGQAAYVVDGSHKYKDITRHSMDQGYNYRPLKIEDDVQIYSKVTVINNIGRKSIIASNSIITREIPAYCLAGGVPAKVLEYFGPEGEEPPELEPSASGASTSG